jgi:hypothetical protein
MVGHRVRKGADRIAHFGRRRRRGIGASRMPGLPGTPRCTRGHNVETTHCLELSHLLRVRYLQAVQSFQDLWLTWCDCWDRSRRACLHNPRVHKARVHKARVHKARVHKARVHKARVHKARVRARRLAMVICGDIRPA